MENESYDNGVPDFTDAREAKEHLVSRIVDTARSENIPLSEVERKMLYFSETHWTLPDIVEVNDAFRREHDQAHYERKIRRLAEKVRERTPTGNEAELKRWRDAVKVLEGEDHYLLLMIPPENFARPASDYVKLIATALAIVAIFLLFSFVLDRGSP